MTLAVALSTVLGCSHGSGTATEVPLGTSQPGAAGDQSPQSPEFVPASPAGSLPSGPGGVAATGRDNSGGAAAKSGTLATPPQPPAGPTAPGTAGELSPLAQAPARPTDSAHPVPPVPAKRTVTVSAGPAVLPATGTCTSGVVCYSFRVSVVNFPAQADLAYTCADGGGVWWGPSAVVNGGTTRTNASGDASFITYCTHPWDGAKVTVNVGAGGLTASGSFAT